MAHTINVNGHRQPLMSLTTYLCSGYFETSWTWHCRSRRAAIGGR